MSQVLKTFGNVILVVDVDIHGVWEKQKIVDTVNTVTMNLKIVFDKKIGKGIR